MNRKSGEEIKGLSVIDAIETLSSIANLEIDENFDEETLTNEIPSLEAPKRNIQQINKGSSDTTTLFVVREALVVILKYFHDWKKLEEASVADPQSMEGLRSIMSLVGEAAKKLDKFTFLFNKKQFHSITQLDEYKQLQEFFQHRIAKHIKTSNLDHLVKNTLKPLQPSPYFSWNITKESQRHAHHAFVNLEDVKKDSQYDLFFLLKENGSRFFSPRLLRNMELVYNFSKQSVNKSHQKDTKKIDAIFQKQLAEASRSIINTVRNSLESYLQLSMHHKDTDYIEFINKGLLALFLAAQDPSKAQKNSKKNLNYFIDFQMFLNEAIATQEYQDLLSNSSKQTNKTTTSLLELIHTLCYALYHQMNILTGNTVKNYVDAACERSLSKDAHSIADELIHDYLILQNYTKAHFYGPLSRILKTISSGQDRIWSPSKQQNFPNNLFNMVVGDKIIEIYNLPCPVNQEYIHKAVICDEFKGFLNNFTQNNSNKKIVIFNLQDKTSWKEQARCKALEQLTLSEYGSFLSIVTLPKDTDFFNQKPPYHKNTEAEEFIQQLKEHLLDLNSGFQLSNHLKEHLNHTFIDTLLHRIHHLFFANRNILRYEDRLDFIELCYLFIEIEVIQATNADLVFFCCKDGIDNSVCSAALLFTFYSFAQQIPLEKILPTLNWMIHSPAIFYRERLIILEKFIRMVNAIRTIELVNHEHENKTLIEQIETGLTPLISQEYLEARTTLPF